MRTAILLWAAIFTVYCATLAIDSVPGSRYSAGEVRVLLLTHSIVADGDIDLRNQYEQEQWRKFTSKPVRPRAAVLSGERLLEPIGIGLPMVLVPAYAIGGATGAQLLLAGLLALAVALTASLSRRLVREPWATGVTLALGLSPPMLAQATTISPEGLAAALLAGAALLALRIRNETKMVWASWCACFLAVLPWIALRFVIPGAAIAVVFSRWLRRRKHGVAGFVSLELLLISIVVFLTVSDRMYGGLTPDAVLPDGMTATGAHTIGDYFSRLARLGPMWFGRSSGILWWAPAFLLFWVGVWRLWHSRREKLWRIAPDQINVDVTATLYISVCVVGSVGAALTTEAVSGIWFAGHDLVPIFGFGTALAAWGAARIPRTALAFLGVGALLSAWFLAGGILGSGSTLHPALGPLSPWL